MKLLNSAYAQFGFDKFAAEREHVLFVNDSDDTVSTFEKTKIQDTTPLVFILVELPGITGAIRSRRIASSP